MNRFALALVPLLAAPLPALACRTLDDVRDYYADEYGETAIWIGMSGKDHDAVIVMTAPDGSWSLIQVRGNRGCLIDFGNENSELGTSKGGA